MTQSEEPRKTHINIAPTTSMKVASTPPTSGDGDVIVVFAGGGTAGHIEPGLAVADELTSRGLPKETIHFIGSERGIETRLVPERGYTLTSLPGRGILRKFAWRNIKSAWDLGISGLKAMKLLIEMRPKVVVTVGGYASLPVAAAASALSIPILVMEQNSVPGASNLLASKVAQICCVSFPDTGLRNAVLTGNPCRQNILDVDRYYQNDAKAHFGCQPNSLFVAVVGGSLGARSINQSIIDSLEDLSDITDLHIHHIIGKRDWSLFGPQQIPTPAAQYTYHRVEYENDMALVYQAADLLIARAGATTVAEVCVTGIPTVFIPLPNAPGDHQTRNAETLSDVGAAITISDSNFDSTTFTDLIADLRATPSRYKNMGYRATSMGYPAAKKHIADLVSATADIATADIAAADSSSANTTADIATTNIATADSHIDNVEESAELSVCESDHIDLGKRALKIHIVGIGGAGMRAIAKVLTEMGHIVTGSDIADSKHCQKLRDIGVEVHIGHDGNNVGDSDIVTYSTAVSADNPEIVSAIDRQIVLCDRATMLAAIVEQSPKSVLVAGTHGKTTTASLLVSALETAGAEPSFIIGSDIANFGTGARWIPGSVMVVEADESDGTFLKLRSDTAIVTSVDPDHIEFYGSVKNIETAFVDFVHNTTGKVVICAEDIDITRLFDHASATNTKSENKILTYGTDTNFDMCINSIESAHGVTRANIEWDHSLAVGNSTGDVARDGVDSGGAVVGGTSLGSSAGDFGAKSAMEFDLSIPGKHNILNAAAALTMGITLGYEPKKLIAGLSKFSGVSRRFEYIGRVNSTVIVDDYAHLPAEVAAVTQAAREAFDTRILVAFQPHRYSRTRDIGPEFADAFESATQLYITELYPAGETPIADVSAKNVFDIVQHPNKFWIPTLEQLVERLEADIEDGDVVLTLGAGDITKVGRELYLSLLARPF